MSDELKPGDKFRSTCQVAGDDWTVEEVYEAHCADGRIRLVVQADDGSLHFGDECVKQEAEREPDSRDSELVELRKELDRQANEAWMRGDIKTADRLAKLVGWSKLPSEHEAADLNKE